jgi:hypothetical protein
MGMYGYDSTPIDLEEEERQRQAAIDALRSAGASEAPPDVAPPPVELPERVSPETDDVGLPGDSGSPATPSDPDQDGDTDPPGVPDVDPVGALANTPLQDASDEPKDGAQDIIARASAALKDFGAQGEGEIPPPTAESVPRPGKGPSDAERSPAAAELPSKDGTPAPPSGQVQAQTPEEAKAATKVDPYDPLAALMQKGEEQKREALKQIGERPSFPGWALVASAAFNHGQDIPDIIKQADAAGRQWDEDKRKLLLSGGSHNDPVSQMLAMERIRNTQRGLDQGAQRLTAAEQKKVDAVAQEEKDRDALASRWEGKIPPEKLERLKGASVGAWRTMAADLRQEYGLSDEAIEKEGEKSRSKAHGAAVGTAEGTHDTIATRTSDTAALSAADANARLPAAIAANAGKEANVTPIEDAEERRKVAAAARADEGLKLQREGAERAAREEQRKVAEAAASKNTQERQQAGAFKTHFSEKMRGALEMISAIDKLDEINAKYGGKDVPGKGAEGLQALAGGDMSALYQRAMSGDPEAVKKARDADEFANNALGLSIDRLYEKSGKTFGQKEIAINAVRMAQNPLASPEQVDAAVDTLRGILKRGIVGEGSARPELTRELFAEEGLDPDKWLPTQWKPREATQPTAAAADSGIVPAPGADPNGGPSLDSLPSDTGTPYSGSGASGSLGDTGSRKNVPAAPITPPPAADPVGALADAGKPTYRVTITLNGQTFDEDAATAEELQMLERSGAHIKVRK